MSIFDLVIFVGVVAAVSGLTPTLLGIFTSLVGGSLGKGHSTSKIWFNATAFFAGFTVAVTAIGYAFSQLLTNISNSASLYICVLVAVIAVLAALLEIKDYFWYGRGLSHVPHRRLHGAMHKRTTQQISLASSFTLGVIAVAATASNIGLVVVALSSLLACAQVAAGADWFVLVGLCLLIGPFITLLAVVSGVKISAIIEWKEESKAAMRLGSGLALLATAWLILLIISHTIRVIA